MMEKKSIGKYTQIQKIQQAVPERDAEDTSSADNNAFRALPNHPTTLRLRQNQVLQLQRTIGNDTVQRMLNQQRISENSVTKTADQPISGSSKPPFFSGDAFSRKAKFNEHHYGFKPKITRVNGYKAAQLVQLNPAIARAVIRRALGWLGKRGTTVSKHVAKHTRRIAGKAIHTVFRSPNQVKKLVQTTLSKHQNIVVQKVGRKTRYIVEKEFNRVIGKGGEKILKVVIDKTGRIVTAYPVKEFTKGGAAAMALYIALDEAAAETQQQFDQVNRRAQAMTEREEDSFWGELLKTIVTFGLYSGSLNRGESAELYVSRATQKIRREAYKKVIKAVEEDEQRSLGPDEIKRITELVDAAISFPMAMDALE